MSRAVIVRPEAEAELTQTFRWYERQFSGLGSAFLLSIDATLQSTSADRNEASRA